MLCMLCHVFEDSQNNCIYEKSRYLLHLATKNVTANELQYFSNKTNKQTNRNIEIEFQNSIERLSFLCQITDI